MTGQRESLLAFVASTQNAIVGFILLFLFAMGLGTVLVVAGTFSGILAAITPSGKWMVLLQKFMALAMIALGCFFIYKAGVLAAF